MGSHKETTPMTLQPPSFAPRSFCRAAALRAFPLLLAALWLLATPAAVRAVEAESGPNGAIYWENSSSGGAGNPVPAGATTAAEAKDRAAATSPTATLLRALGSLAIVLGLMMLAAYLFKRYGSRLTGAGPTDRADTIRIVSTKLLGGRRSLMLIRVRGQTLLLGVTPQSINCLTEIQELEGEWAQPSEAEGSVAAPFERHLGRNIDRKVGSDEPGA